jgi:thiazole biosynthesis enzyme
MHLNEKTITEAIIKRYTEKLLDSLKCDVAVVGGGPSGLVAAKELAGAGWKTCLFERKLSIGGGMWGGGMMMNEIVVQEEGKQVLDEYGIRTRPFGKGYFTADAIESVTTICSKAAQAGVRIFNLIGHRSARQGSRRYRH